MSSPINSGQASPPELGGPASEKGLVGDHGHRFESKLPVLYALRAINLKYEFRLGREMKRGEKFDDLVFEYKNPSDRFHYLQAKHKDPQSLNKENNFKRIKSNQLLGLIKKDKDFDLKKYFESYVKIKSRGEDIEHCIICTNVDFDHDDLRKNGITLEQVALPKLLDCTVDKPKQKCYKLKLKEVSNILNKIPYNDMREWIMNCTGEGIKHLFKNMTERQDCKEIQQIFSSCQDSAENVKAFSAYTADDIKLSLNNWEDNGNEMLKGVFACFFDDFLDKLIFSVKTPNEEELDNILEKEVEKYFKLSNATLEAVYIIKEMVDWFKKQDNLWLTNKTAGELMALWDTTAFSVRYKKQLSNKNLEFNDASIDQLKKKLKSFWDNSIKVMHINSKSPKLTAVKVLSAIQKLPDFPQKDDCLVIPSQRIQDEIKNETENKKFESKEDDKEENKELLQFLKVEKSLLLVVVDETKSPQIDNYFENPILESKWKKKIILITSKNSDEEDSITVGDLSEKTKNFIKSKQVSFQETNKTVGDLIDLGTANELFDSNLIENLLTDEDIIEILSFPCSNFKESLYIKRQVVFPSADELIKKLARKKEMLVKNLMDECKVDSNGRTQCHVQGNEELWKNMAISLKEKNMSNSSLLDSVEKIIKDKCQVDSKGRIQWFDKDEKEKEELWENMAIILKENNVSDCLLLNTLSEERLIDTSDKKRIIIRGVAGTGKSTILSHYYKEIKKKYSDWWVIKINLVDHTRELRKTDFNIRDFFIYATGIDQNPFAQLLLKHRLETGDRIVIMLDGFDEIDTECQSKVIQLVNKFLDKSIPLYITTRTHMADQLQFELSQLAYSLVKFEEKDQIDYMTSIWTAYSTKKDFNNKMTIFESFARELICQVSETLKDKEKEFLGIPLQCRILAECFQSKIIKIKSLDDFSHLLEGKEFNLANLYKMMFEEKRRVFRDEKIKVKSLDNHIAIEFIDDSIRKTEVHLRNLAIQIIVEKQNEINVLIPSTIPSGRLKSEEEKKDDKESKEYGIKFGLLKYGKSDGNTIQFLHRTYAEYLLADYIYNGFVFVKERHEKLLENESVMNWIVEKLLVEDKYNGVRVFFDSMLKEITDHEEWKKLIKKIKQQNLPDRLQKFARLLRDQRKQEESTLHVAFGGRNERNEKKWALHVAFRGRNVNTVFIILDCLDVLLTASEIQPVIIKAIEFPFHQRPDVFQRILDYFKNADDEQLTEILVKLCKDDFWDRSTALELKQENVKRNLVHFLDFMGNQREKVKFVLDEERRFSYPRPPSKMSVFFIRHGGDDLMKDYFTLVSSVYSDDLELTRFMKKIIREYQEDEKDWQIGRIKKALIVLRDIGQIHVTTELARFVLLNSKKLPQEDRSWLEEMGKMTGLYGMAYRGDLKLIEKEIEKEKESRSLENPEIYSEDLNKSVLRLMLNDDTLERNESEGEMITAVTPFEVAAAYGYEEICRKFIKLLPDMADIRKLSRNAIQIYDNVVMCRTILKSFKAIWGQNAFISLLKSEFCFCNYRTSDKKIFETIFCVVVEDKENGYRDANELVFQDEKTIGTLVHVPSSDILKGMIAAAEGFENWMKRLMGIHIFWAFDVLKSKGFLDKLHQIHLIPQLIAFISTLRPSKEGTMSSYWSDYAKGLYSNAEYFIEVVAKRCGEDDLKRLSSSYRL